VYGSDEGEEMSVEGLGFICCDCMRCVCVCVCVHIKERESVCVWKGDDRRDEEEEDVGVCIDVAGKGKRMLDFICCGCVRYV